MAYEVNIRLKDGFFVCPVNQLFGILFSTAQQLAQLF